MPRLSPSEKRLLTLFGVVIAAIVAVVLFTQGLNAKAAMEKQLSLARQERAANESLLSEADMWAQRGEWMEQQLPRFPGATAALPRMQEAAKAAAQRHGMTVKDQSFIPQTDIVENPAASAVGLRMELTGQLPQVIAFLNDLQQPGRFIAIRQLGIKPEGDTGALICTLELLQYFREG